MFVPEPGGPCASATDECTHGTMRRKDPEPRASGRARAVLKHRRGPADDPVVRLERLVVGSGGRTLTTELHPHLTVVDAHDASVREALVGELLDALAGARPGVHLELELGGRDLAVFRPPGGRHRVIDTGSVTDVTATHTGPDGEIDLFASLGADRVLARRTMRFGRDDLVPAGESDAWIARLAGADQEALWDTAMRCRAAEQLLDQAAAGGLTLDDAPIVREVEARHAALVAATDTYERMRLVALTIGTIGALGAIGMVNVSGRPWALPFLVVALAGIVLAVRYRRAVDDAAEDERGVLRRAGADDYHSFHYERVSALLDTDRDRRRFMQAVGDHRRAMEAWADVAGPVPLPFALEHERAIRLAAERHAEAGGEGVRGAATDVGAELAPAVVARLAAVRALTSGPETLPLLVDDPFDGLDAAVKPALLDRLAAGAVGQQVVVVTADPDVVAWAERAGDGVALVEPAIASGGIGVPA